MMERTVIVTAVVGHEVWVRAQGESACGQCPGSGSCSTLGAWANRVSEIRVQNTIGAKTGDEIVIAMPDGLLMRAAWRLYGIPMLAFIVAGVVFQQLAQMVGARMPDLWAVCGGILALAGCYGYIAWRTRQHQDKDDAGVRILRIARHAEPLHGMLHRGTE